MKILKSNRKEEDTNVRIRFKIFGQVQGVGFRPFVYNLAQKLRLSGFVANDTEGALIEIEGKRKQIDSFRSELIGNAPPLARISKIDIKQVELKNDGAFVISGSLVSGQLAADVTVDVAICSDCLREMFDPSDRRFKYPFINCTNCGPRYTIVRNVPYDRPNTTMSKFRMCKACQSEYENPSDRRFHAQPIACPVCGPKLYLQDSSGNIMDADPISTTVKYLKAGKIVAIKGIGGFHLAVDACNDEAVRRLRRLKKRDRKPFALMLSDMESIEEICVVDEASRLLLEDIARPIVLLEQKTDNDISHEVAPGLNRFGVMLPYAPQHYLLFAEGLGPIVMTSANFSEEPIIADNDEAIAKLGNIVDLFLMHNRDIYRKIDDSVVQSRRNGRLIMLRRSRGFVPQSLELGYDNSQSVLGVGAELKNTIALAKGGRVIVSEHIGDLKEPSAFEHFRSVIGHLCRLYDVKPEIIVADIHNDYMSSRYAMDKFDLELIRVQHHHAHIVSCMLENNLDEQIIGISADGVGLGTDGNIWGCELMIADRGDFERKGHLQYFGLPGSDASAIQTFRPALALLWLAFGERAYDLPVARKMCGDSQTRKMIFEMIAKKINMPITSSLGRLFDAVSALAGIAMQNYYEGQAPMMLESLASGRTNERYSFEFIEQEVGFVIDIREMIKQIVKELEEGEQANIISDKFHNTVADFLASAVIRLSKETDINKIVLSGGCFANKRLSLMIEDKLIQSGLECYQHKILPCNDGGISAGQVAIAAARLRKK